MSSDRVLYLNQTDTSPLFSKLRQTVLDTKQGKASVAQWGAMIAAFTQKGVKKLEIDEVGLSAWLATQDQSLVITKDELLRKMLGMSVTVKEVVLRTPLFSSHRQPGGNYSEFLYIANSERDNVDDELETVEYEMEDLSFHLDRLEEDPDLLTRLEERRTALIDYKPKAIDFPNHHFSSVVNGKHGRNLLAHCRVIEYADTYFIQEIQSDWAQRGRAENWGRIPRGPFVTNTEAWSGMVLRRHLQLAAQNPAIKRIAWMTETMRNGWVQNSDKERADEEKAKARGVMIKAVEADLVAKLQTPDMTPEQIATLHQTGRERGEQEANKAGLRGEEGMNAFYLKMLPKLAEKALQGTSTKVGLETIDLKNGRAPVVVPAFEITDAVRAKLIQAQPLYSRAPRVVVPLSESDPRVTDMIRRCGTMLGSPKHLRLFKRLYDTATGHPVAGSYINKFVQIALNADDIDEVGDHESFHFAEDNLLAEHEKRMLLEQFAFGGVLNTRVQEVLVARNDFELALHCHDPKEAAAQGFALWRKGLLDVAPEPVTGVFSDIVNAVKDVFHWLRSEVLEQKLQTPEAVFKAFENGELAQRRAEKVHQYEQIGRSARSGY